MRPFGLLVAMAIAGTAFAAQAEPALVDFERNWIFPRDLGGLRYVVSEKFAEEDFGYRILYRAGEACEAEINVYDLGQESIPDGWEGEGIDLVLKTVEDELQLRLKRGEIENLKRLQTTVFPKSGAIRFATVVSCYNKTDAPDTKKMEATYVTALKGRFIRLRFAFDNAEAGKANAMGRQMVAQLAEMAAAQPGGEEILMTSCSVFLNDPGSFGGITAAQYLMDKAQAMGNLNVYTDLFVWPTGYYSKPRNVELLIAGYFAGMLQVVVPQQLDEGGEYEAFSAMLDTYRILRSKEQISEIKKIEEWAKHPDRRALYKELLQEFGYE